MQLAESVKQLIIHEYNEFKAFMYANSPKDTRDQLGQFFTPAEITIKMLECYSLVNSIMLDPTSGSGNLLAACLIAGVPASNLRGNEFDARMVKACRDRLKTLPDRIMAVDKEKALELAKSLESFNDWQIHRGDATDSFCLTYFGPDYKQKLEEHFLEGQHSLFPMLTKDQEEFLKEVD